MALTIIRAAGALIGVGPQQVERAEIWLEDGLITSVETAGARPVPPGAEVIDFGSAWVLPGLIDTHVHLIFPGDGQAAHRFAPERTDLELLLVAERNAERALAAGVTTLRDVGSRGQIVHTLRDAIGRGESRGPRIRSSGPAITVTGGHCHYLGGEADGVDAVRLKARQQLKAGADLVKVMGSGGGTPGTSTGLASYSQPEMAAAVTEARRRDTHITVHCTNVPSIEVCLATGVDMLEHAAFWVGPPSNRRHDFRPDLVETIVNQGTWICPTLQASYGSIKRLQAADQSGRLTAEQQRALDFQRSLFEMTMEVFRQMHRSGVRLVAGTDAGWDVNPFGSEYVTGLELAANGGMPAWEVIEHATSRAAAAVGLSQITGSLRPGLAADLVVVAENPLNNLGTLRSPIRVFAKGIRN